LGVPRLKLGPITLGKVGYALACIASAVTLVAAGYAYEVVRLTVSLGDGVVLGNAPSTGATNILVMGLESRTTLQGQNLSVQQLVETHSGNESEVEAGLEGSQDTDTLILIHIFAGGHKAVGFSIPRDDVVNYPHEVTVSTTSGPVTLTEGKIDAAYAYAYTQSLDQTSGSTMTQAQRYLAANQAGQLFEVQTVESVTGVHVDHFIVSDIIGFYELAQQFGGLEVCIQPAPAEGGLPAGANLSDYDPITGTDNSGFDALKDGYNAKKGGKQYLHLSASQSLAYVRSRDTLPGVDIGRTARQQAVIEYIVWKLKTTGVLSDLGDITTLLSSARSYLMYDSDWDLTEFAVDMRELSSSHLNFTTLPEISTNDVSIPGYSGAQSANYIDVPQIQQQVNQAFYGSSMIPLTAPSVTVDVYNGSGTDGLAADVSQDLVGMGYKAGAVDDSSSQSQPAGDDAEVFYGAGSATEANAQLIANVMGVQSATPLSSLPAGHVEVLLGSQVTAQAPGLEMFGADSVNASDYVTAAEQNDQSVPANVQAAANADSQSDVPAYSQAQSTPSASASPGSTASPASSASASPGSAASPASSASSSSPSTSGSIGKKSSRSAKNSEGSTSPSNPNPLYGLTTCPY
jgi:anionic cell wall polymer biosynthesis LytR-Cps2A-Psr (LCP) family protein